MEGMQGIQILQRKREGEGEERWREGKREERRWRRRKRWILIYNIGS
jgi:hypothetical protein